MKVLVSILMLGCCVCGGARASDRPEAPQQLQLVGIERRPLKIRFNELEVGKKTGEYEVLSLTNDVATLRRGDETITLKRHTGDQSGELVAVVSETSDTRRFELRAGQNVELGNARYRVSNIESNSVTFQDTTTTNSFTLKLEAEK